MCMIDDTVIMYARYFGHILLASLTHAGNNLLTPLTQC